MKRDLKKMIQDGQQIITSKTDLRISEFQELQRLDKGAAIVNAFWAGAAVGARNARKAQATK